MDVTIKQEHSKLFPSKPLKLPVTVDFNYLQKELSFAYSKLIELKGESYIKDSYYLAAPLFIKEAQKSSSIEGIHTTLKNTFLQDIGEKVDHSSEEVANYKKAISFGFTRPPTTITIEFIKTLHKKLLEKIDEDDKPGEYRDNNDYVIGSIINGKKIEHYKPVDYKQIDDYMNNLCDFINNKEINPLIRAAIMHYQIEAIHPFRDGNGRIGRILIPLFLYSENLLDSPAFYISGRFKKFDSDYKKLLHKVDLTKTYEDWIKYFLVILGHQAESNIKIVKKIYDLFNKFSSMYINKRYRYMNQVLIKIFTWPYFRPHTIYLRIGKADKSTISKILKVLLKDNVISKVEKLKTRKTIYFVPSLLQILNQEEL